MSTDTEPNPCTIHVSISEYREMRKRIRDLEEFLRKIDSINDNPARYSSRINDLIQRALA